MKKLIAVILFLLILLGFVVAFLLSDVDRTALALYEMLGPISGTESAPVSESETRPTKPTEPMPPAPSTEPASATESRAATDTDSALFRGNYIYEHIDEAQQTLYREIYGAITAYRPALELSEEEQRTFTVDDVAQVYNFVLDDNPDLFWVDFGFSVNTLGPDSIPTGLQFTYLFDKTETAGVQSQIDAYEEKCLARLSPDAPLFDKILHVYEYIINNTEYNLDSQYNQNMISVALYGESVCKGYAKMTQYLLNRMGIPCTTVNGYAGEPHSWDLVNADGNYYYLDPTWGDPQKGKPGKEINMDSYIAYQYFMITDKELAFTHQIDDAYPYPVCNSTALNYYTYRRRLFDAYDYDTVAAAMREDFLSEKNLSTIRFDNEEAYQAAQQNLIENQDAFQIMADLPAFQDNGSAYSYTHDDDFRTLDFVL